MSASPDRQRRRHRSRSRRRRRDDRGSTHPPQEWRGPAANDRGPPPDDWRGPASAPPGPPPGVHGGYHGWPYGAPPGVPPPRPGVPMHGWQMPPQNDISRFGGQPPAWSMPRPMYGSPGQPSPMDMWTVQRGPPGWGAPPPGPPGARPPSEAGRPPPPAAGTVVAKKAGSPAVAPAASILEEEEPEEELPPPPSAAKRLQGVHFVRSALSERALARLKAAGVPLDGGGRSATSAAADVGESVEEEAPGSAAVARSRCTKLGLDGVGATGGRARLPPPVPGPPRLPPCTTELSQEGLWDLFKEQCGTPLPADAPPMLCELRSSRGGGHVVAPVVAVR